MRVFRYILRFLGISATLLWLLCSFARAQDNNNDVTVNFPDEMTVSGQVEITNLGITGDPVYDDSPFPAQGQSTTAAERSGISIDTFAPTYLMNYEHGDTDNHITLFSFRLHTSDDLAANDSQMGTQTQFVLYFPRFNWDLLRKNFTLALFGNKLGINNTDARPSEMTAFPFIGSGRGQLQATSSIYGRSTVVTDQIGNGNWSINFSWDNLAGSQLNSGSDIDLSGFSFSTFKTILNGFLAVVMWYECVYLIIVKVSQG